MTSVAFVTAVSGLSASALRAQTAAYNIANANTANFAPLKVQTSTQTANGQGVGVKADVIESQGPNDLASNIVDLNMASVAYSANATVIRTLDQIGRHTIDLLA